MPKELIHKLIGLCCCLPAIIGFIWWQFKIFWCGLPIVFGRQPWFDNMLLPNSGWAVLCLIECMIFFIICTIGGIITLANSNTTIKDDIGEAIKMQLKKQSKKQSIKKVD